ncbi:MAG: hypothetical protein R2713_11455 [Ilumatobacteraceae bacterium]
MQGAVTGLDGDSAEHGGGGRHDLQFDRHLLVLQLGSRGVAPYGGSGARPGACDLRDRRGALGPRDRRRRRHDIALRGRLADRGVHGSARRGRGAAHLTDRGGGRPGPAGERSTPSAPRASRRVAPQPPLPHPAPVPDGAGGAPLSGLRRAVVVVLLAGVVLSGRVPFEPDARALAALWAPWFVLSAVALHLLSAGELRPGDRVRTSMRLLGVPWRGCSPRRPARSGTPRARRRSVCTTVWRPRWRSRRSAS